MKDILSDIKYAHIKKMILEFTQSETNKIFVIGNTVTFYVKASGVVHPIKMEIIPNRSGEEIPNIFYAKSISDYPIDLKGALFVISQPNQDIRSGKFEVDVVGKVDKDGVFKANKNTKYTFKNIFKIEVRDKSGKLIDIYYANKHDEKNDDSNKVPERKIVDFIEFMGELKPKDMMVLSLENNKTLELKYIDTKGNAVQFEADKNSELPSEYVSLYDTSSIQIIKEPNEFKFDPKNDSISIKIKIFQIVNGEIEPKDSIINNVIDWTIGEAPSSIDDGGETADDVVRKAEEMMKEILGDPLMKKAFYSQPSLWNMIVSAVKGENPRGTGIAPAWNIINQYGENKIQKALGPNGKNFKSNKQALFEVMYEGLEFNPTGQVKDELKFNPSPTRYRATVMPYKIGGDNKLTLENKKLRYKIRVLKPYREIPDAFEVSIIKLVEFKSGEIKEFPKSAIIHFISENGSGYYKTETKQDINK